MADLTQQSKLSWESLYDKKVWVETTATTPKWPSVICDPKKLDHGGIVDKVRLRALSSVGKKYTVYYFGMPADSSYGFVSVKQLTEYTVSIPPLNSLVFLL